MANLALAPLVWLCRGALYIALGWCAFWAYRWARSRAPILGAILAIGIVARAALGAALFVISYYGLPFLTTMQLGGGFWTLAPDARSYFHVAASATILGISSIPEGSASPAYVRALTLWLDLVGVSAASAVLLNLGCYVVVAVLIIDASASVTFAAVVLSVLTFSPALIIFGTQALKDPMCVLLIVLAFVGARMWVNALSMTIDSLPRSGILGATYLSAAVFGLAGIRAYFALFIMVSVVAMGFATLLASCNLVDRMKVFAGYSGLVALLWVGFMFGAGAYYPYYGSVVNAALGNPFRSAGEFDRARAGFVATGGATSLVQGASDEVPPMPLSTGDISTVGVAARAARTARGCAVLFVPITMLRALSLVSFTGGRGLLFITDVDTLVIDLGMIASFLLLFRRGLPPSSMPVAIFALTLAALTTLSLAYVVTNFGTLFRLRLLAVTPIWVLPAFVKLRTGTNAGEPGLTNEDLPRCRTTTSA